MYDTKNTFALIRFVIIAPLIGWFLTNKILEALYESGLPEQTKAAVLVFSLITMVILFLKGIDKYNQ